MSVSTATRAPSLMSPIATPAQAPVIGTPASNSASEPPHTVAMDDERSEEHTSELQSRPHLVCRLLLEKKKQPDSGYLRAKVAQEAEIDAGAVPFTILRATQFFEYLPQIAAAVVAGESARLSNGLLQFV